jgi:UDP-N-acetylmuramoyl-tripeptide--D-alanyl-D-alanine ligase
MMLSQLSHIVDGSLTGADVAFDSVSIDSRTITSGALFVALKGPNFDGHDYIARAREQGAAAALVSEPAADSLPAVKVEDTRLAVLSTIGNLNNDLGLPLTLLRLRQSHRYAVTEMGMNHPGELTYLTSIARPDVAVITNAAAAHLEGLQSVEGVARAKSEIFSGVKNGGTAVINDDDEFASLWRELAGDLKLIGFSLVMLR